MSTDAPPPPLGAPETPAAAVRRPRWPGAGSIQSKLLVMLLLSSILSAAVVGIFGYRSGTQALRDSSFARLTDLRDQRTTALRDYMNAERAAAILNSQGISVDALKAFDRGFAELADVTVTEEQRSRVAAYYADVFLPGLQANTSGELSSESFLPSLSARTYLQAEYTATSEDFDEKLAVDDAGDGSRWSHAHAKYHPFYREVVERTGTEDVMLINSEGDVVYTAYKGVDLGSNIKRGEFRGGGLERAFDEAVRSNSRDYVALSDLELYQPSYNLPAGFIASPIVDGAEVIGVYVAQIPITRINGIMTGDQRDDVVTGLGETGETYLGGPDDLMRSNSREIIDDPEEYADEAVARGTSSDTVERALAAGSTVMLQPIKSEAHERASNGESGTIVTTDYLGHEVLDSFGPAGIEGLDWTVIAKMNTEEAFEPVRDFARNLLVATALVILLVCAASVLMARVFTLPLNRLVEGVRAVAGGDLGAQVDSGGRTDEFGDLGVAFNDMSSSLRSKQLLLEEQQAENSRILGGLMPAPLAERYRGGETEISAEHEDVSVVYVEVEGFDKLSRRKSAKESLELLNTLSRGFDEAARAAGIEKVRQMGTGYVASSGLVVQRVDHARRVVDFALSVADMLERFNSQNGSSLSMRAGINTGSVSSGLVGRSDIVYNLWGDAVELAYRVRTAVGDPGIYVTDEVRQRLGGGYSFQQSGTVTEGDTTVPVWAVQPGNGAAS
jgi:class 3 adenylate cyclase